jgi:hypothetical protein
MTRNKLVNAIAVLATGLAICSAAAAQSVDSSAIAAGSAESSVQRSTAVDDAVSNRYMTSVQTELTSKVDTKNAAVGQEITAKTRQAAKLADGTTLPKGTKLVGHVTQVEAKQKGQANSMLAMTFDKAELKDGQTIPVHSVMRSVAPPVSMTADDPMMDTAAVGPIAGTASSSGAARGGALGGIAGGGLGGVGGGGIVGGTVRGAGQAGGSTLGTATAATGNVAGSAARTTGAMVAEGGETVSSAARATALPGVMLSSAGSAGGSGTLSAAGKNITLESGTQMTLGVVAR